MLYVRPLTAAVELIVKLNCKRSVNTIYISKSKLTWLLFLNSAVQLNFTIRAGYKRLVYIYKKFNNNLLSLSCGQTSWALDAKVSQPHPRHHYQHTEPTSVSINV